MLYTGCVLKFYKVDYFVTGSDLEIEKNMTFIRLYVNFSFRSYKICLVFFRPYNAPPRPVFDPSRPPGPVPSYPPGYPPHRPPRGRDYPGPPRGMRGRTPPG